MTDEDEEPEESGQFPEPLLRDFAKDAADAISELAREAGSAAVLDLARAANAITVDLVRARLTGDELWTRELLAQAETLAELQRLRVLGVRREALRAAFDVATRAAANIATRIILASA